MEDLNNKLKYPKKMKSLEFNFNYFFFEEYFVVLVIT